MKKRIWLAGLSVLAAVILSLSALFIFGQFASYVKCNHNYQQVYKTQTDKQYVPALNVLLGNLVCSARLIRDNSGIVAAIATVVIAGFTFLLWWSTHKMWKATSDTAEAARRSADAVIRIESPIIRVFSPPLVSIFSSTSAQGVSSQSLYVNGLKFINHGRTPAFPERLDTGWMVINKLPATPPVYTNSNDLSASDPIITETFNMTETSEMIEPTADQWEKISKRTRLWYYGCLYYRNFMNDRQEFRFCWGLFNAATTGQNPVYSFLSYGDIPEAYTKNT